MSDQSRSNTATLEKRRYKLRFAVRKSIRYHDHRRNFYLKIESWIAFVGLVLGSGAAVNALSASGAEWISWAAPGLIAALSAAGLVIRASRKAALHANLYSRFARLEKRFLGAPSLVELDEIESERLDIEMDEPTALQALVRTCHNEVLRSEGRYGLLEPLCLHHRLLKNLWRFDCLPVRPQRDVACAP